MCHPDRNLQTAANRSKTVSIFDSDDSVAEGFLERFYMVLAAVLYQILAFLLWWGRSDWSLI